MVVLILESIGFSADSVIPLQATGPDGDRIVFVIIAEGYDAADLEDFPGDAQAVVHHLFSEEPFASYRNYFNVYGISVESAQSGVDVPAQGIIVNTAFDGTLSGNILTINGGKALNSLIANKPDFDIVLALVNTPRYGGSGGLIGVASTHQNSAELAAHELGHSFVRLADEYDSSGGLPSEAPNATAETDLAKVRWKHWIEPGTPVPTPETSAYSETVGLFEGAAYRPTGWYRPHFNSKMRTLGRPWGQINSEAIILKIYSAVAPFRTSYPPESNLSIDFPQPLSFSLQNIMEPIGHQMEITWQVDGIEQITRDKVFILPAGALSNGRHEVRVAVNDPTPMVRDRSSGIMRREKAWGVNVSNHLNFWAWVKSEFPGEPAFQFPELDVDLDGQSALEEFVLGSRPGIPNPSPIQVTAKPVSETEIRMIVEFERGLSRVGVAVFLEVSSDLLTWIEIARSENSQPFVGSVSVVETPDGVNRSHVRIEDLVAHSPNRTQSRFVRFGYSLLDTP